MLLKHKTNSVSFVLKSLSCDDDHSSIYVNTVNLRIHLTQIKLILTSSVLVAQIWKPPHISQADAEAHLSQKILHFTVPPSSSGGLRRALLALLTDMTISP